MSDRIITFDHVWKKFQKGERHTSLRDLIPSIGRSMFARQQAEELAQQEFWALRDVSFEVRRGEALGIIGPNGAGKSTTLKLLTKIMRPTRGHCAIVGRTGALIEVAAGFHPDLTGRENVFLQGAIMGMRHADIARKLDAIVEFSGLADFIDTQVKRYSSGMNARLGFSIAANLEPDALVIDEVLAVGDLVFQKRCLARMHEFKRNGVAIVFVSHNLRAVADLCDRAILIGGSIKAAGSPVDVIQAYTSSGNHGPSASPQDTVVITAAELTDQQGVLLKRAVVSTEALTLRVSYLAKQDAARSLFDFQLYRSSDSMLLYEGHFDSVEVGSPPFVEGQPLRLDFAFSANLAPGRYRIVTRVRDTMMKRFLAETCPFVEFSVAGRPAAENIANLEAVPMVAPFSGTSDNALRCP